MQEYLRPSPDVVRNLFRGDERPTPHHIARRGLQFRSRRPGSIREKTNKACSNRLSQVSGDEGRHCPLAGRREPQGSFYRNEGRSRLEGTEREDRVSIRYPCFQAYLDR